MKYAAIPQIYTIIAFGASLALQPFMPRVVLDPSMDGMPRYLVDPLFTMRFSLWLTTAVVWFIAFALSLRYMRKKRLKLTEVVGQNLHVIVLATFTVMIALIGWVAVSDTLHFRPGFMYPEQSPLLFHGVIALLGILFCIPAWIIVVLGDLSACWARP